MRTTFLSLPRELRDQIYNLILISPTHHIEPSLLRFTSKPTPWSSNQSRFALCTNPLDELPLDPVTQQPVGGHRYYTSLSICRVCRQMREETVGLFWERNTFYFSTFYPGKYTSGLLKTLKQMGQTPSRLIQRITLQMSPLSPLYTTLSKVLLSLSSRARHGSFRKLTLTWGPAEWNELVRVNAYGMILGDARFYDDLLDNLSTGGEGCRYERVIEVPGDWTRGLDGGERGEVGYEGKYRVEEATGRALHLAFGGKLFIGGVLAWDNYQRVRIGARVGE